MVKMVAIWFEIMLGKINGLKHMLKTRKKMRQSTSKYPISSFGQVNIILITHNHIEV